MASKSKALAACQKLGKSLMTPIAVLPAAGILLRLGQKDVLNISWMASAGNAIFNNLPIIFALGIAVGFAEENNGVAGLSAAVGYFVLTNVATTFNKAINLGVLGGIIIGILAGNLYNKYKAIKLPDFLGFFGGKRFVPIVTSGCSLILGVIFGYVWPAIQGGINAFGNAIANLGAFGAFIFGFLNRLLIPVGLHQVLNSLFLFTFGSYKTAAGKIVTGDLNRFYALDKTAGTYMTGFFPIMMFALPAACLAMITVAKKENRKKVSGMLLGIAFTAFLTGITEPIEFTFMFLSPVLYFVHAVLTGTSMAVTAALGIKSGFTFSAGCIDYVLSYGIATKPLLLIVVGLIYAVIYYFVFLFVITKFNLPTPGRFDDIDDEEDEVSSSPASNGGSELSERAAKILEAIGGKGNIDVLDACVTRIRLTVKDGSKINEARLKKLGATGVMRLDDSNVQIVVGTIADILVTHMKEIIKSQSLK
ncbi:MULTISPECIES: N-acetylglucosamine-specific PTS transporter subunit IIBC [Clostridium]|uniref:N-acetylglucosamine-specific PTS transporter subunit IIBC n=1 Tax=Clostridium TaxID=1485 RepID=UPI00069EBAB5|nr:MULTISPECIES: N-acetylglucosamine-specific PTS transporter subunit IIBC [Clostridium]KOF56472.1 PTS sugar transporter [Clostridium sp. DMHC 10]MCD2346943.1 N-acetylglucosamine-specific PTS transporter subunit IIBC [Clostridium guangxiense]